MIRVITPREELTDIEEIKIYLEDLLSINEENESIEETDNYATYNTEKVIYEIIEFIEEFEKRNFNIAEIDIAFNLIDLENIIKGI